MKFLSAAIVSVILALAAFAVATSQGTSNINALLLMAISLAFCAFVMLSGALAYGGIVQVVFGLYMVLFYLFPGMLHAAANSYPFYGMVYNENEVLKASILVFVFSASLLLGVLHARYISSTQIVGSSPPYLPKTMRIGVIWIISFLAIAIMAKVGFGIFLLRRGDPIYSQLDVSSAETGIILLTLARSLPVIALAASIHRLKYNAKDAGTIATVVSMTCLNIFANNPLSISRFQFFGILLVIMPLLVNIAKPSFKLVFISTIAIGIGTIFPVLSHLQRGQEGTSYGLGFIEYYTTSGDLDGFQSTINVVMLADATGLRWGWQILSGLAFFIPRTIWPTKGIATGAEAADSVGYLFTNISSPLPSEFYIDFGYLGCLLGGYVIGRLASKIDFDFVTSPNRHSLRFLLMIGGAVAYEIIMLRGPILGVIGPVAVFFSIAYLCSIGSLLDHPKKHVLRRR